MLSLRLEFNGAISAHCNLCFLGSNDSCGSASLVAVITDTCQHEWLGFCFWLFVLNFFSEDRFRHAGQSGLELLTSSDPSASASQRAGITGVKPLHLAKVGSSGSHFTGKEMRLSMTKDSPKGTQLESAQTRIGSQLF